MLYFMIILIPCINLSNLSWIIECLFFEEYGALRAASEFSLRKHAYSNIMEILQPKKNNFQIKKSDIFHISAQNINCGTR